MDIRSTHRTGKRSLAVQCPMHQRDILGLDTYSNVVRDSAAGKAAALIARVVLSHSIKFSSGGCS